VIRSMTGFAALTRDNELATIGVTVKSVNHRYLDLQLRLPQALSDREGALRSRVQGRLVRGRVEVSVSLQWRQTPVPDVILNMPVAQALAAAMAEARDEGIVQGALTPADLLRVPQVLSVRDRLSDAGETPAAVAELLDEAVEAAVGQLDAMRREEGRHLAADLTMRREMLTGWLGRLVAAAEAGRSALETRLLERAQTLARDLPVDAAVLAQEVVRVAARSDIAEEVTRFQAHLQHWQVLTDGPEACGRKLDFLLQEMNREVNTMGSKADGLVVTELIIDAKAELERMREQVQNVE
jgi:uncharacterized protein (TIGR00255 family)